MCAFVSLHVFCFCLFLFVSFPLCVCFVVSHHCEVIVVVFCLCTSKNLADQQWSMFICFCLHVRVCEFACFLFLFVSFCFISVVRLFCCAPTTVMSLLLFFVWVHQKTRFSLSAEQQRRVVSFSIVLFSGSYYFQEFFFEVLINFLFFFWCWTTPLYFYASHFAFFLPRRLFSFSIWCVWGGCIFMLRILPFFFHADYSTLVFGVCGVVVVTFFVYGNLFFCPCGIQDQIPFFLLYFFFWGGGWFGGAA